MPVVVTYDDINALGPLALQAGYQSGYGSSYTQGRESQLNRRSQDERFLLDNTFQNQRLGQQQNFQAGQAETQRNFQGQQAQYGRDAQMQEQAMHLAAQQAAQQTGFNQDIAKAGYQDQLTTGRQTQENVLKSNLDMREAQAKQGYERQAYMQAAAGAGISPEQAAAQYNQIQMEKIGQTGGFAKHQPTAASAADPLLGTLSGANVQNAMLAMDRGAGSKYLEALGRQPGPQATKDLQRQEAINAMVAGARNPRRMDMQTLQKLMAYETDPELRQALGAVYSERTAYGGNQAPQAPTPTTGGPGVGYGGGAAPAAAKDPSQMSPQELMAEWQSLSSR